MKPDQPQPSVNQCGALLRQCVSILNETLRHLTDNNTNEVYRNRRIGLALIEKLRKEHTGICPVNTGLTNKVYIESLMASAESVLEICRTIISSTGLPLWQRCELDILRHNTLEEDIDKLSENHADYIAYTIKEHLNNIDKKCPAADSWPYQYLRLLQNLRIFIICRSKLFQNSEAL